jgi:CheY-like chemotaxis protein
MGHRNRPAAARLNGLVNAEPVPMNGELRGERRPPPDLHGVYVLVVEDDADGLDLVASMLRSRGAVVAAAISARDGLAAARLVRPNVVVTDIAMPGEDGYWLADQLKAVGIDVPVIAMSAFRPKDRIMGARPQTFQRFIPKPIDPVELCRAVGDVVRLAA